MKEITIFIDGKELKAIENEYILNIARENGIFIPAICYLTRCSPTLACKLCMVEANGKRVYSCNAKAKEGMDIITTTPEIEEERRAILEVYDINHPLQCGVCDKSGECELQNYTLEMGVDVQHYHIADSKKEIEDWGHAKYDPYLCIMCERCVTVCKDMVGDAALKTTPRGTEALDKDWKDKIPKDAFSIWNRINKNIIGRVEENNRCEDCGECIAVCPVGALANSHFQYTSNAWELTKIPATCPHCSAGCLIDYEIKHTDIENSECKIYRVTNDWNYVTLCGAGRFGYENKNSTTKCEKDFLSAMDAFLRADTIRFSSFITNEEALILQRLKEKRGYKLINSDAYNFQKFLEDYSKTSGSSLYSGSKRDIHSSDLIFTIGGAMSNDNPNIRFALNNSGKLNKASIYYSHTYRDKIIQTLSKTTTEIVYKPLKEELVLLLLIDSIVEKSSIPEVISVYLESFKEKRVKTIQKEIKEKVLDEEGKEIEVAKKIDEEVEYVHNTILDELGLAQEFSDELKKDYSSKSSPILIAGSDLYSHKRAENIARLLGFIEKHSNFKVLLIPTSTNTLGVSLICDLDKEAGDYVIGYNDIGDYRLSSLGDGDLDMPALNQQEGTFTTIDKRVVPTNAALPYGGYELNDIAKELGVFSKETIRYTKMLPTKSGFVEALFDELPLEYTNGGVDNRGYELEAKSFEAQNAIDAADISSELEGDIVYKRDPISQFNEFTKSSKLLEAKDGIYCSLEFLEKRSLSSGDLVELEIGKESITHHVYVDDSMDGDIVALSTFQSRKLDHKIFGDGYRYVAAKIKKV